MNGLKYIRTRCNLSLNELADIMGISRQALSSWETGKKEIPTKRLEQLESIFGLDKKYFAEINEEDKQQLLIKAMFLYEENGKQSYRYAPCKCQYKNVQKVENKNVQFSNFYSSACASI